MTMQRTPVKVIAVHETSGYSKPLRIALRGGGAYDVKLIGSGYPTATRREGGQGVCFDCEIDGKRVRLYYIRDDVVDDTDLGMWCVEGEVHGEEA